MRNLKKVLSLALAFVMLMGMMIVGAGAAVTTTKDYTDAASVTKTEAVDVMSAVGIFNGTDGAFAPQGNLTRAEAAAIITRMLLGTDAANALVATAAPYADVAANNWAAGAILYCTNLGIVSGIGNNQFGPAGQVTGNQFAKMLLVALGYDPDVERFTGSNWSVNVGAKAYVAGLMTNMTGNMDAALTRESAAQMAFNAMTADMVEYSTKGTQVNLGDLGSITIPGSNATKIVASGVGYDGETDNILQFCERYFPGLKSQPAVDKLGNAVNAFYYNNEKVTDQATTPLVTFTADYTGANDNTVVNALASVTFPANGTVIATDGADAAAATTSAAEIKALTANGKVVSVFINADRAVTRVAVYEPVLVEVTAKVTVTNNESITLSGGVGTVTKKDNDQNKDFFNELYALEKGDYVLVAANGSKILAVLPSTQVSGKLTGYTGSSLASATGFTVNGTSYKAAGNMDAVNNYPVALNNDVIAVVDQYGYVKGFAKAAAATVNFGYVIAASQFGDFVSGISYQAQLVTPDGSIQIVNVSKVDGNAPDAGNVAGLSKSPVSYTIDSDGKYALTELTNSVRLDDAAQDTDVTGATNTGVITKGSPMMKMGETNKALASNKTVFIVIGGTAAAPTYTAYVGIGNVPTMSNVYGTAYGTTTPSATVPAEVVVIRASSISNASNSYIYYLKTTQKSETADGKVVEAIVDGVQQDVTVSTLPVSVGLYTNPGYNDKGVITNVGSLISTGGHANLSDYTATSTAGVKLEDGLLKVDGGKTYAVADGFIAYTIDAEGKATIAALSGTAVGAGATVYVSVKDGLATGVYIQTAGGGIVETPDSMDPDDLAGAGSVNIDNNTAVTTGNVALVASDAVTVADGKTLTIDGNLSMAGAATVTLGSGSKLVVTGTLTITDGSISGATGETTVTGLTAVSKDGVTIAGTLKANGGLTATESATITGDVTTTTVTVDASKTLTVDGTLTATGTVTVSGTAIAGTGTLTVNTIDASNAAKVTVKNVVVKQAVDVSVLEAMGNKGTANNTLEVETAPTSGTATANTWYTTKGTADSTGSASDGTAGDATTTLDDLVGTWKVETVYAGGTDNTGSSAWVKQEADPE